MSDLAAALMVAIRVHAGQVDKQGQPYLLHVLRVVERVSDEAKVVAALHDVLEDGGDDAMRATLALDLSAAEGNALKLLTRMPGEGYGAYVDQLACSPLAREVKLADLRDNLGQIPPEPPTKDTYADDAFGRVEEALDGSHDKWRAKWASLKARYEKAIATLEGSDQ